MEENIAQYQSAEVQNQQEKRWLKIGLLVVAGLVFATGLVFAGMQIGRRQATRDTSYETRKIPTLTPTQFPAVTPTPYTSPEPTLSPLLSEAPVKEDDETAGWRSYISQEGKFSIKYPSNWPYVKGKTYEGDIVGGTLEKIHFGTNDPDADNKPDEVIVFMAVYKDSSIFGRTPAEYFQTILDSVDLSTKKNITVGGLDGIRALVKGAYPFSNTVVLGKDGFLYRIELLDTKVFRTNKEENTRIFDLMLSTFRFLE